MWLFNPPTPHRGSVMLEERSRERFATVDQTSLPPWHRLVISPENDLLRWFPAALGEHHLQRFLVNGRLRETVSESASNINALTYGTRGTNDDWLFIALVVRSVPGRAAELSDLQFRTKFALGTEYNGTLTAEQYRTMVEETPDQGRWIGNPQFVDLWDHPIFGRRNLFWMIQVRRYQPGQQVLMMYTERVTIIDSASYNLVTSAQQNRLWRLEWHALEHLSGRRAPILSFANWVRYSPVQKRFDIREPVEMQGSVLLQADGGLIELQELESTVWVEPEWM